MYVIKSLTSGLVLLSCRAEGSSFRYNGEFDAAAGRVLPLAGSLDPTAPADVPSSSLRFTLIMFKTACVPQSDVARTKMNNREAGEPS